MKTRIPFYLLIAGLLACLSACRNSDRDVLPELRAIVDSVRLKYVPDRRDNVYDIEVIVHQGKPVVKGFTSDLIAAAELPLRIERVCPEAVNNVIWLPDKAVGEKKVGVINVSVADTRTAADYAAEMATQLLLGAPVDILRPESYWWQVKSAEGYVAWITGSSLVRMTEREYDQWRTAPKIIFTDAYGFAYESPDEQAQRASDLVFGNLLKHEGERGAFYRVAYPDGRIAYVPKRQSRPYGEWLASRRLTEESIVGEALRLKGIPYMWGGTSVKGMDCSGFTKTVYLMHGIVLRRDASQQAKAGIPIDISAGYENLRPGDLLFFGKKAADGKQEQVRHVAIYMGNKKFIHAAGAIKINSFDPKSPVYDESNTREFIRAARVIGDEKIWKCGEVNMWQCGKMELDWEFREYLKLFPPSGPLR
jgi:cell wall-associated NlpC family hydrolase